MMTNVVEPSIAEAVFLDLYYYTDEKGANKIKQTKTIQADTHEHVHLTSLSPDTEISTRKDRPDGNWLDNIRYGKLDYYVQVKINGLDQRLHKVKHSGSRGIYIYHGDIVVNDAVPCHVSHKH